MQNENEQNNSAPQNSVDMAESQNEIMNGKKAEVMSPRGKRMKGRGFSRDEIDNAGLTMQDVKRLHIPYDKRRKSLHSWNIERLQQNFQK